jgi:hypothetical protein
MKIERRNTAMAKTRGEGDMTIHWHFEKAARSPSGRGESFDQSTGYHGGTQYYYAETSRSSSLAPLLHGMADIREFATACFVWGCVAAGGLALFVAWFVAATLIYWG